MKTCGCDVQPIQAKTSSARATETAYLVVDGMGCPNCAMRVRNALVSLDGVTAAHVSVTPPLASVRYDPECVALPLLIGAVADAAAGTRHEYHAWKLPEHAVK